MKKLIFLTLILLSFSQCVYDDFEPINTDNIADTNTGDGTDNTSTDGGDTTGNTDNTGSTDNTTSKTTYLADVKPIMNQLCVSCHGPVNPEDDLDLSTYSKVKSKVDKIIEAMDKQNGDDDVMPPNARTSEANIQTIKDWKTDGLLEGEEPTSGGGGNTNGNITYTTDIKAVLDQECTACHSATNASGGLNLTTYTNAKNNINTVIARIDLQTGQAGIMPTSGRMAETKIQLFKDWLAQGLLEQ